MLAGLPRHTPRRHSSSRIPDLFKGLTTPLRLEIAAAPPYIEIVTGMDVEIVTGMDVEIVTGMDVEIVTGLDIQSLLLRTSPGAFIAARCHFSPQRSQDLYR
jgi:hypothetical protein